MRNSNARHCRRALGVLAVVLLVPAAALAQRAAPEQVRSASGIGYAFAGFGGVEGASTFHLGGGGEVVLADVFGVGSEIGYLAPTSAGAYGVGMLSVNGTYHMFPRQASRRIRPFVTAGYTLGFRRGHANLWNFGGGVDCWLKRKFGLRAEFRDHLYTGEGQGTHFWGFRGGVIFR